MTLKNKDKMEPELRKRWYDNLRSGKFKRTINSLVTVDNTVETDDDTLDKFSFCCLGVLMVSILQQADMPIDKIRLNLEHSCVKNTGLPSKSLANAKLKNAAFTVVHDKSFNIRLGTKLASELNDLEGKSFDEIADLIEEHL